MSQLTSSNLVLVTGANGHVAQHVVDQLLNSSYPSLASPGPRVRGTVRSQEAVEALEKHFAEHVKKGGRLEIVRVPDIKKEGAFDGVLRGVTHIAHIASPLIINPKDTENDLLIPAIKGTTNLFESASREKGVQKIVLTSTFGSICDLGKGWRPGYTYTDADWNPITYEEVASPDLDLSVYPEYLRAYVTYCASKKLAEKSAWDFLSTHDNTFELSVINPTYIAGPHVLPLERGPESFSFSNGLIWKTANQDELLDLDWPYWVDVRDVARAHIEALARPEASGKRFLVSNEVSTYDKMKSLIHKNFPQFKPPTQKQTIDHYGADGSKALSALGLGKYITLEQTIVDTLKPVVGGA